MRWISLLSASAVALTSAFAGASAMAQTKIDFFFPVPVDGKLAKELQRLTKVYNDSQKDVAVTPVYSGNYDDTKLKAQAAAKAGKPPAVALMSANYLLDLKLSGDLLSLEPMLKAEGTTREKFLGDFWPALHGNAVVDGELYGVPYQNSTPLLYYNKDHFKEAGLDPEKPPQTWAELVEDAKKLTKDGRWGFQLAGGYDYLGGLMQTLTMTNGGRFYNEEYGGEVYYDTPSMLGAAQFVEDDGMHVRAFFGHSGWSAGQLENELKHQTWIIAPPPADLFTQPGDVGLWRKVLTTQGSEWRLLAEEPEEAEEN